MSFPGGSAGKESACNAEGAGDVISVSQQPRGFSTYMEPGATPRNQGLPYPVVIRKPASLSLRGSHTVLLSELSGALCAEMFSFRADKGRERLACAPSDVAVGQRQIKSCTRQAHSIVLFNPEMLWIQSGKTQINRILVGGRIV